MQVRDQTSANPDVAALYEHVAAWARRRGLTAEEADIGGSDPMLVVQREDPDRPEPEWPQMMFDPNPGVPRVDGAVDVFSAEAADVATLYREGVDWRVQLPSKSTAAIDEVAFFDLDDAALDAVWRSIGESRP